MKRSEIRGLASRRVPGLRCAPSGLRGIAVALARRLRRRAEVQREAVDAVALAGRRRAVVEDVAEMAAAAAAMPFRPRLEEGVVLLERDVPLDLRPEAWPAGAGLEFRLGGEDRQVAAGAVERALGLHLEQRAGPGPLGAFLAQHRIL